MTARFAGVVIVAAGRGERFGNAAKVLVEAGDRPLLAWSLEAAASAVTTAEIVVVCGKHTGREITRLVEMFPSSVPVRVCEGGVQRQDSVHAGLDALSDGVEVVVIHDAARPLATPDMFDDVSVEAWRSGAAIIAAQVTDTIKQVDGSRIQRTIPRDNLYAAQTPQAFRRDVLADAMARATAAGTVFTDEAGLLEWAGVPVVVRSGVSANLKVTVQEDVVLADALLRARREELD